jgi:hypothetical protein
MQCKVIASCLLATSALWLAGSTAAHAATITVIEPDNGDPYDIHTFAYNDSAADILSITFDFSGATASDGSEIVLGGNPISVTEPAGGSATYFGSGALFGFQFTGFAPGKQFGFQWDPDSAFNDNYSAIGSELRGGVVTVATTLGTYAGTLDWIDGAPAQGLDVGVRLQVAAVPEPGAMALLLAGGGVAWGTRQARRRKDRVTGRP